MKFSSCLIIAAVSIVATFADEVLISNVIPRRDTSSAILDAHDGKVIYNPATKTYLWAAASYGNCTEPAGNSGCSDAAPGACGFQLNHNVSIYESEDLVTWQNRGEVLQMTQMAPNITNAVLFCPKLLFNTATKLWVLWFNWISGSDFSASYYAVATSVSPYGPYILAVPKVTTLAYADTGDFNLLQDTNGDAYLIYTAHITAPSGSHRMSIEKLTPDYLGTLGNASSSGFFGQGFVEAPAVFTRQLPSGSSSSSSSSSTTTTIYYATFGQCCCYCQGGSPVDVYTAPSPLGPWTQQNNIGITAPENTIHDDENCPSPTTSSSSSSSSSSSLLPAWRQSRVETILEALSGSPKKLLGADKPGKKCAGSHLRASSSSSSAAISTGDAISAQQTDIFQWTDANGDAQFMYIGDRWQSSPDGLKAHDFTVWLPLQFTPDGNITAMTFLPNFTINI